jgi:predicted negative regulator of RcsB-dependent stress response
MESMAGRVDNAIGMLKLDAEYYSASGNIPFLIGEALLQKGDTAGALASYRDALAKDSTIVPARRRIAALTGGGSQRP